MTQETKPILFLSVIKKRSMLLHSGGPNSQNLRNKKFSLSSLVPSVRVCGRETLISVYEARWSMYRRYVAGEWWLNCQFRRVYGYLFAFFNFFHKFSFTFRKAKHLITNEWNNTGQIAKTQTCLGYWKYTHFSISLSRGTFDHWRSCVAFSLLPSS